MIIFILTNVRGNSLCPVQRVTFGRVVKKMYLDIFGGKRKKEYVVGICFNAGLDRTKTAESTNL